MNRNPFVSVIIPNYNHARYLDERITSVLNQTYQHFEIIILDDKSTDNSIEVINKYAADPHLSQVVINKENTGLPFKQWKKGFELAKGELIWIAESDDMCHSLFLESLLEPFFQHEECVLSFSRSLRINEKSIPYNVYHTQKALNEGFYMNGTDFIREYLCRQNIVVNASSALIKKSALIHINSDYSNYHSVGDWLFWIYLTERGGVSYNPFALNWFRFHSSNTTQKLTSNGISEREMICVFDYLKASRYLKQSDYLINKYLQFEWHKNNCLFKSDEEKKEFKKTWGIRLYSVMIFYILIAKKKAGILISRLI